MSHQDAVRFPVSRRGRTTRPKRYSRSPPIDGETEELPPRVLSSSVISATDTEDQSTNSRDESASNISLKDAPVATGYVVLNQYPETSRSSISQLSRQQDTNHDTITSPSLYISQQRLSGIEELSLPVNHTTRISDGDEMVAQLPTSCPTCSQSVVVKPSDLQPRNSKLSSNSQSLRLQDVTTISTSPRETDRAAETWTRADSNCVLDSEAEEEFGQFSHSVGGIGTKRENTELKSKLSETGEQTKKGEFTKLPSRNQLATDACDTPNFHPYAHRPSANDTATAKIDPYAHRPSANDTATAKIDPYAHRPSVNDSAIAKSGSFSIPGRTTNVTQVRPGTPSKDSQRTPYTEGLAQRCEISPRNFMSTVSMISLENKPSKIPRPVQRSARTLTVNRNPPTNCENRYSVYNVFSIIMTSGFDDRAEQHDSSSKAVVAAESIVEENNKCTVVEHRSFLHPAVQKIQTYEPVKISSKLSEIVSAIVSVEPKVLNTLLIAAKAETTDNHVIRVTEFQDAIRVYEPVVPTNTPKITEQSNADKVISAEPPADKESPRQTIVSIIPSVIVSSVQVKEQKKSKSVKRKAQRSVQSPVRPAVQSTVEPAVQSSVQPAVQSVVQSLVQPVVQSPVVRPARRTSSLASSIVEESFTDLDKEAFQTRQLKTALKEPSPNSTSIIRSSKGHSQTMTPTETTGGTSREEILTSASRNALKAIVKAILASTGVQLPEDHTENQSKSANKETRLYPPSHAKIAPRFATHTLSSSISQPQTRTWSSSDVNRSASIAIANQDRTKSNSKEHLSGQYPLGSSVTQIFSKHRKDHHQSNASDNSTSWSKALYAKTLYFKNENKDNPEKQTNPQNPASNIPMPSSKMKPWTSKLERSDKDQKLNHDHLHSAGRMLIKQAAKVPPANSAGVKLDDTFDSLEQTVNNIIRNRFGKHRPIQIKG